MNINSTVISGYRALQDIRWLLVTDKNIVGIPAVQTLINQLEKQVTTVTLIDNVPPESSQHDVAAIIAALDMQGVDSVVGIGGGSVLGIAKLLSVLCMENAPTLDALLKGEKPQRRIASLLIPANAGTGSEAVCLQESWVTSSGATQ
ncbi:iron-containing alcohol dehydrogenase [Erwinia tracheiphila]|uniref:Iron-containing alcohol dehydrogenase n=1 Tax=Erwinia tracheiphila TaxID=65700 RepID=A0A345CYC1_9GAMM|nr:iron-containing alcohol dehydrogenase [Erwinia tracheiphila]